MRLGWASVAVMLLAACESGGSPAPAGPDVDAAVAKAVEISVSYFAAEVRLYRSRQSSIQAHQGADLRGRLGNTIDQAIHQDATIERLLPGRMAMSWVTSRVYADEPGVHYPGEECDPLTIVIGTSTYGWACDGTWSEGDGLQESLTATNVMERFHFLTALDGLTRMEAGRRRGEVVDVYEGTGNNEGRTTEVHFEIGREDGVIRYVRTAAPGVVGEWEFWDFNAPDIVIEAPALE